MSMLLKSNEDLDLQSPIAINISLSNTHFISTFISDLRFGDLNSYQFTIIFNLSLNLNPINDCSIPLLQ